MSAFFDLVGALIDGAGRVPFLVWVALVVVGCAWAITIAAAGAEYMTPEQRDEIARRYREYGGKGVTPSTRSTAPPRGGTSPRHPTTRGQAATAQERCRPRRDRQDDIPS